MLEQLPYLSGVVTRMISAENPTGEKGGGARSIPDPAGPDYVHAKKAAHYGRGWKVRPFIRMEADTTVTLADIKGRGVITQLFLTSDKKNYSDLVLRMYWDGETTPSVEVPMGAFFCIGHNEKPTEVFSVPITVAPNRGCNCYFQMPFRKGAVITLTNEGAPAEIVAYKIMYQERAVPADAAYFHAQYRRTATTEEEGLHTVLDGVRGKGIYVGTYMAWTNLNKGWWGEGEVKFFLDGDKEFPSICDNGTEDYFGGAWNFGGCNWLGADIHEQVFNSPFLGLPQFSHSLNAPKRIGMYRFHVLDGIGFSSDLKVTVQTLGWRDDGVYKKNAEDVASVAYWYQTEPHAAFPALPPIERRWDR
jgi:hypothetical protein